MELRLSNMTAAKGKTSLIIFCLAILIHSLAISDAVRTSLGPKGMDKMVLHAIIFRERKIQAILSDPNLQGRGHCHK